MTIGLALGTALATLLFAILLFAFTSTRHIGLKSLVLATVGTAALWATSHDGPPFDDMADAGAALVIIFALKYAVARVTGHTLVMLQARPRA